MNQQNVSLRLRVGSFLIWIVATRAPSRRASARFCMGALLLLAQVGPSPPHDPEEPQLYVDEGAGVVAVLPVHKVSGEVFRAMSRAAFRDHT